MKLSISTPFGMIVNNKDILSLSAEDASGSFGILPLHADFMTVLGISVLSWRDPEGQVFYCALNCGILVVEDGKQISIATREAVLGQDFSDLKNSVIAQYSIAQALEEKTRLSQERIHAEAIRKVQGFLHQDDHHA